MSTRHESMFDSDAFNRTLFFPRPDASEPPPGAVDHFIGVDVDERAELHLRVHSSPAARATVLFFHGNGEVVADYDDAAPRFASLGAALAVVDYRGYGRSTGRPTLRAVLEDSHAVLELALDATSGPVVVMGRSLGSGCANELYGGARVASLDARVAGFVLESGYTSIPRLAERRQLRAPPPDDVDSIFDPLPKLRRGRHPLLVMHGARDTLIRPDEAQDAFDAAGTDDKQLLLVEGRGHNDISGAREYWDALAAFLRRVT